MQSVVVYGRLFARAFFTGFTNDFQHAITWRDSIPCHPSSHARELHLVTAAAGIGKGHLPHQVFKKWSFGDDACFIAGQTKADVIGVADGVGGWREYGVDPSQFPLSLMQTCERLVKQGHFQPKHPRNLIKSSYEELLENKSSLIGSCTACIISLYKPDKTLYTANLGDSGFLLIRDGKVIKRSEEQQHYFNTPFQLAVAPSTLQGLVHSDSPDSAASASFGVQEGDIILVGTDGLFDNMNEEMILRHIRHLRSNKPDIIQKTAEKLAQAAHRLAFDPEYMSPFAMNANAHGFECQGGKPDDITVMLGYVTHEECFTDDTPDT